MSCTLVSQEWRLKFHYGHNLDFNPPGEYIQLIQNQECVHFIHTGKCAGESIIAAMKRDGLAARRLEYHAFDANKSLDNAIQIIGRNANDKKHFFIILTRDPIDRWESSFNWDIHNIFLSKGISLADTKFANYMNVNDLSIGIAKRDPEALALGRFGHMRMGISFYTPKAILENLDPKHTHIIRTEMIDADYSLLRSELIRSIPTTNERYSHQGLTQLVPYTKNDFKKNYPRRTFSQINRSDTNIMRSLKKYLKQDYEAHELAISKFAKQND